MDYKALIKEVGLGIFFLAVQLYFCGLEYFFSIFHFFGVAMIIVPLEYGLAEGLVATFVTLFPVLVASVVGYVASDERIKWSRYRHILALPALLVGWFTPYLGDWLGVNSLASYTGREALEAVSQVEAQRWIVSLSGLIIAFMVYWARRAAMTPPEMMRTVAESTSSVIDDDASKRRRTNEGRWYLRIFALSAFIICSFKYSSLRGKSVIPQLAWATKAKICFRSPETTAFYAKSRFVPILDRTTDLVLVRYDEGDRDWHHGNHGTIVLFKKDDISIMTLVSDQNHGVSGLAWCADSKQVKKQDQPTQ